MAATRKSTSDRTAAPARARAVLGLLPLRGKRLAVGLSGGVDSVVLLHVLHALAPELGYRLSAIHVNHGLSPSASKWARFCSSLCKGFSPSIPLKTLAVKVRKSSKGLEAAAREARRAAFARAGYDVLALAHQQDDQAETVLFNLLRGAGLAGARGMAAVGAFNEKPLVRPLLEVPRPAIEAYARAHELAWIEDESNASEAFTRNFLRRSVGPLLATRFPRWRENLARASRHFATREVDAQALLRSYLKAKGLRAPSESKLLEMLRQLTSAKRSAEIRHDGTVLRRYRNRLVAEAENRVGPRLPARDFKPVRWNGESSLPLPELGGELRFRKVNGQGIDPALLDGRLEVRLRAGGERLQPDPRRPRRTLKNLFQEAGIPPWERERLPLLTSGDALVWAAGLGVDSRFSVPPGVQGLVPTWVVRS